MLYLYLANRDIYRDLSDDSEDNEGRRVLRQAFDEGHQIGSHTWSHQSLPSLDDETFDSEVSQIEDVIKQVTGRR